MDVLNYAQEFTQLLSRWTRPVANAGGSAAPLLTSQQILNTTQDVLKVMLGIDFQMPDYSSVQTPAMKIAVCTPNAPFVSKSNLEIINTSLGRSLDTLTALAEDNADKSKVEELLSKSQEKLDVDMNGESKISPEEKRFISRSSPAIHVTNIGRSDTFVCEEEEKKVTKSVTDETGNGSPFGSESSPYDLQKILKKIDSLRVCASAVVSKIEDMKKDFFPQETKPIRRLSSIGINRSTTLTRPIPPPKLRRSSSGFPGTPTSSKLNTTVTAEKNSGPVRRKSIAVGSVPIKQQKLSPSNRTISVTATTLKKSPSSVEKPSKRSKYAHVQSTIPKPLSTRRNAQ